jgi:NADH:ubiquinone oxidoreductase subunit E
MTTIMVCVGSSCYIRGAHAVAQTFLAAIEEHRLGARVELTGSFCLGRCKEGVAVNIDGQELPRVTPENAAQYFATYVKPELI